MARQTEAAQIAVIRALVGRGFDNGSGHGLSHGKTQGGWGRANRKGASALFRDNLTVFIFHFVDRPLFGDDADDDQNENEECQGAVDRLFHIASFVDGIPASPMRGSGMKNTISVVA